MASRDKWVSFYLVSIFRRAPSLNTLGSNLKLTDGLLGIYDKIRHEWNTFSHF